VFLNCLNWIGAAALAAAPFFIDTTGGKVAAIVGLTLLSRQAYKLGAFNLLTLNAIGIIGYFWSIL